MDYQPKEGNADAFKSLVQTHVDRLKAENLVTDRELIIMEAADGTTIEVFEWLFAEAIQQAHQNKVVHQMWGEFGEVCDYVPLNSIAEAASMFAEFGAVE
ncbi:hypothetical protein [Mucilaginibacter gilvus]|uniref:hypothetical protein n=1 Tax=Mucilaginibacter gilvus TaxID=2305909 RepID=UPI001ABABD7E|nr:hypothetical protein [Mucilaginibacter gilvus]